jgi:SpoVK/Ycf46/Vps4 family AAA+-type ATPase
LDAAPDEQPILPQSLLQDIEGQVFSFFQDQEAYRQLQLRHRRGFLFVGPPGTGKTMTIRHLIRECFRRYKPSISTLRVNRNTDESDLDSLFSEAIRRAPGIVILEDLDSLTSEAGISRSAFLAQLDGLSTADGLLIIGTTNNPEKIDPALIHRPSRFDRVWHFPLPDYDLRVSYLVRAFESLDSNAIESLSERTNGWSFAYLSELRTTAAIRALNRGTRTVTAEVAEEAHELLDAQFRAGRKNHREEAEATVGFQLNMA